MKRIRAERLGSLCVRQSCDPGSGLARRAQVLVTLRASYRAFRLFVGAHRIVGAGLPVGPALLSGRSDGEPQNGRCSWPLWNATNAAT
jgi:hypothetical protein